MGQVRSGGCILFLVFVVGCAPGEESSDGGGAEGEGELVGCESLTLQPSVPLDVTGMPHLFGHDIPVSWEVLLEVIVDNEVRQELGVPTGDAIEREGMMWTLVQGDVPLDADGRDEAMANYRQLGWPDTWGTVDFYGEDIEILEQRLNNYAAARMWLPAVSTVGSKYYEVVLTLRYLDNDPSCNDPVDALFDEMMSTFGPNANTSFAPEP